MMNTPRKRILLLHIVVVSALLSVPITVVVLIYFIWSRWTPLGALVGTLTLLLVAAWTWKTSVDERRGVPTLDARPAFRVLAGLVSTVAFAAGILSAVVIAREFTQSTDVLYLMLSAVCIGVGVAMAYVAVTGTSPIKPNRSGLGRTG